jgi:hypothetical protein
MQAVRSSLRQVPSVRISTVFEQLECHLLLVSLDGERQGGSLAAPSIRIGAAFEQREHHLLLISLDGT